MRKRLVWAAAMIAGCSAGTTHSNGGMGSDNAGDAGSSSGQAGTSGSNGAAGFSSVADGSAEANDASVGNEPSRDGALDVGSTMNSFSQGQGDAPAAGSDGVEAVSMCGAGEQAAVSNGLPAACATCLCSACPKAFGTPTGMDDPAIIGDVEAGLELPGGSNAQGCDANCWLFWSCMYMNGCAELNAFDVSGITKCLTSSCVSQYAAIGGKWPNDTDLCSVEKAKPGEQRACSAQCRGD